MNSRALDGQLTEEEFGSHVKTTRTYEPNRGLLTAIDTVAAPGGPTGAPDFQHLSYTYDAIGNVSTRTDGLDFQGGSAITETFEYDHMDRLRTWKSAAWRVDYDFDVRGNLTGRTTRSGPEVTGSAVQTLSFPRATGAGDPLNAVGGITGAGGGNDSAFTYDHRGRRETEAGGGGMTATTWTSLDLPRAMTRFGRATSFAYTADGMRVKKAVSGGRTTVYVGGLYERREDGDGVTHVFYVMGGGRIVAQAERKESNGGEDWRYLHNDHLGSVNVVSSGGLLLEKRKTDPFGSRVEGDSLAAPPVMGFGAPPTSGAFTRGFTEHEQDDDLALINMRGRIFDPKTGAFLSADPLVQAPFYGQSHNRYGYVFGRPLNMVDPTGFVGAGSCTDANGNGSADDAGCETGLKKVDDGEVGWGKKSGSKSEAGGGGSGDEIGPMHSVDELKNEIIRDFENWLNGTLRLKALFDRRNRALAIGEGEHETRVVWKEHDLDMLIRAALHDRRALPPDPPTDAALSNLDPRIRDAAREQIKKLRDMGIDARVARARVTTEEQARAVAEHDSKFGPGGFAASPGHSLHERGLAFDIQLRDERGQLIMSWDHPWYAIAGDIGQGEGLQWGVTKNGVWGDLRHFQAK